MRDTSKHKNLFLVNTVTRTFVTRENAEFTKEHAKLAWNIIMVYGRANDVGNFSKNTKDMIDTSKRKNSCLVDTVTRTFVTRENAKFTKEDAKTEIA